MASWKHGSVLAIYSMYDPGSVLNSGNLLEGREEYIRSLNGTA